MAKAVINLQKESGGIVKISPVDGIGVTEVTVPESGELVTKEYVDTGAGAAFVANDNRAKTALNTSGDAPIYACRAAFITGIKQQSDTLELDVTKTKDDFIVGVING